MVYKEVLATPHIAANQGVFTFYASAKINAPAQKVWEALLDLESYSEWNVFNPKWDTPSGTNQIAVGEMLKQHWRQDPADNLMLIPCEISEINHEAMRLCWFGRVGGLPQFIMNPEKVNKVTAISDNESLLEIWETQAGLLAYVVKWERGEKLSLYVQGMVEALKKYIEEPSASTSG